MQYIATSPEDYINQLPQERHAPMQKLRQTILEKLPAGFKEEMSYGHLGYVVPHSIYPAGYHCTPKLPLPFMSIASQKNFIAFYPMGIYADETLLNWFRAEYTKHVKTKLDMGKSCIRFKKPEQIPYELIGQLVTKMTVKEWIKVYEEKFKR